MSSLLHTVKITLLILLFVFFNVILLFISCSDDNSGDNPPIDGDQDTLDGDLVDSDIIESDKEEDIEAEEATPDFFNIVFLADTHIIDEFYEGPEGSPLDTETIFKTTENLENARDQIHDLDLKIEAGFVAGDVFHNYPSDDYEFFQNNTTRIDNAKSLLGSFNFPMYPGMGNHDYDIPDIPREMTNRLMREKFGLEPYYYVDIHGFRFISLNNFLGDTMDPDSPEYNGSSGSFGNEQLFWLADLLDDGLPTFIYLHFPLALVKTDEGGEQTLENILMTYKDNIKMVIAGHVHMWMDFGDSLGPKHWTISSTRYDKDAYLLIECDTKTGNFKMLNKDCINFIDAETDEFTKEGECIESPR